MSSSDSSCSEDTIDKTIRRKMVLKKKPEFEKEIYESSQPQKTMVNKQKKGKPKIGFLSENSLKELGSMQKQKSVPPKKEAFEEDKINDLRIIIIDKSPSLLGKEESHIKVKTNQKEKDVPIKLEKIKVKMQKEEERANNDYEEKEEIRPRNLKSKGIATSYCPPINAKIKTDINYKKTLSDGEEPNPPNFIKNPPKEDESPIRLLENEEENPEKQLINPEEKIVLSIPEQFEKLEKKFLHFKFKVEKEKQDELAYSIESDAYVLMSMLLKNFLPIFCLFIYQTLFFLLYLLYTMYRMISLGVKSVCKKESDVQLKNEMKRFLEKTLQLLRMTFFFFLISFVLSFLWAPIILVIVTQIYSIIYIYFTLQYQYGDEKFEELFAQWLINIFFSFLICNEVVQAIKTFSHQVNFL